MTTTRLTDIFANPPYMDSTSNKDFQMSTLLKYLGKVSTGVTIRESVDSSVNGDTRLLQIKDLPKNETEFSAKHLPTVNWESGATPQYLKRDSIIVTGRGEAKAYLFTGNESDKVMISSVLINIELETGLITPEFLVWYINNTTSAQKHFAINSRDMILPMTSIATVKSLPITIPSLEQQQDILELEYFAKQEQLAFQRMSRLRREFNKSASEKILQQSTNNDI